MDAPDPIKKSRTATFKWRRLSGLTAPSVFDGPINPAAFQASVRNALLPPVAPGDFVVINNLPAQEAERVGDSIESLGCCLL